MCINISLTRYISLFLFPAHLVGNKASPAFSEGSNMPSTLRRLELEILGRKKQMLMIICSNVSLHLKQKEILPGCKGELITQPVLPPDPRRKHCQSNFVKNMFETYQWRE